MALNEKASKMFKEAFEKHTNEIREHLKKREKEDYRKLGRFFHFHLLAEDALVKFIKSENPEIGNVESTVTQFGQKLQIAQNMKNGDLLKSFNDPLQKLNEIRNKMGHYPVILDFPQSKMDVIKKYFKDEGEDISGLDDLQIIERFSIQFHLTISAFCTVRELQREAANKETEALRTYNDALTNIMNKLSEHLKTVDKKAE